MSKAFTREDDDVPDVEEPLPPRPRDPSPITQAGYDRLVSTWQAHVDADTTTTRAARIVRSVIDTVLVKEVGSDKDVVGFGNAVVVEDEAGRRKRYVLVGPDEAEPAQGTISIGSPLGCALSGQHVGAAVVVDKPAGEAVLQIVAVAVVD